MSEYLDRLRDVALWFHENKDRGRDVAKEIEFLKKAVDCLLELHAIGLDELRAVDGKPAAVRDTMLYTPRGLTMRGSLRG